MTATVPLGERKNINITAIEKELAALWKQPSDENGQNTSITRACVMTLIAPVRGPRESASATELVAELTDRFPNRGIVIETQANGDDLLDAWVQAHCQMPGSGRSQICCEQITIEARGDAINRVPGVVLPLLVPDVPVLLFWANGEPFASPLFGRLIEYVDRVVIDSSTFEQPEAQLEAILSTIESRRSASDLAWGRLTPWRELTAQFFDSPGMLPHLSELDKVVVHYHARADGVLDRVQALLYIGWLVAKLGWQLPTTPSDATADATFVFTRNDGAAISVELQPIAGDRSNEHLQQIELSCAHAHFQIARAEGNTAQATATIEGRQQINRVVRFEEKDSAGLLADDLRVFGRDRGYEGAMQIAAKLV